MAETAQEVVDAAPAGRAILDLSALERISAGLAALTTEGGQLLKTADPASKDGDKALRAFRQRCVAVRVAAHRIYDEQNKPVLELQRRMRRLRDDIDVGVSVPENPVAAVILAEEQRKEAARRAEAEREQRRIAGMRQRIANIAAMVVLYEPSNGSQQALEGIQSLQLTALAKRIGSFRWKHDMVGYELTFDRGLGDAKSNLVLTDCKLDRWRLTPKDGGSIDVVVIAESSDTSAATFGQLAKLKSCEVSFTLTAAEVAQGELGTAPAPAKKTAAKPKANDATSEFIERNTRPH